MRDFLVNRAALPKESMDVTLKNCILNSTPYVRLKTKRKGKKIKYKIGFIEKEKAERKALSVLSKNFKEGSSEKFVVALEKELDSLATGKNSITEKRDEIHKQALLNSPFRWRKYGKKNYKK